uniref:hypothetical protein n=1 Tax=Sinorhizobium chiapasense TaxID=501572 RepID=UPI002FE3B892
MSKTSSATEAPPDLISHYRPLALRDVLAALSIKCRKPDELETSSRRADLKASQIICEQILGSGEEETLVAAASR